MKVFGRSPQQRRRRQIPEDRQCLLKVESRDGKKEQEEEEEDIDYCAHFTKTHPNVSKSGIGCIKSTFRRRQISEDRQRLLLPEESRDGKDEQEEQEPVYNYGAHFIVEQEDYRSMASAWESRCMELEDTIKRMRTSHQVPLPKDPNKKLLSAMHMMKVYILKLENDNELLSDSLTEQAHLIESRSAGEGTESTENDGTKSSTTPSQQQQKPDWKLVAIMANKLVEAKKEISTLKYSIVLKEIDTETLVSQCDELLYENERLATKCQSLEEAASTLFEEVQASERKMLRMEREPPLVGTQDSIESDIVETEETDAVEAKKPKEMIEPVREGHQEDAMLENTSARWQEVGAVLSATQSSSEESDIDSQGEAGSSCYEEAYDDEVCGEEEIIVETVREDSDDDDDEVSKGQQEVSNPAFEEQKSLEDGESETSWSHEEERDELGPLPSNPFESIRDDASSFVDKKCLPSASTLNEMQQYLEELAIRRRENGEAHEATMPAVQANHADQNASQKAEDARLQILQNVSKHGKWRNKLFSRLKRNETSSEQPQELKRNAREAETDDGVWC
jgi:hypothetical protein